LTYRKRTLAVVTVAEFCRRQLISKGVDGNKITVVHNGIAPVPPRLEPVARAAVGLGSGDVVVGVISRLDHVKGVTYLLDAAAWVRMGHPEVHVVLVGDGGSTGRLRRQSQDLGISSHVHFVGYRNNALAWLDLFDIFAMPSLAEYHSIGLLEAMRAGKAIVATDVGGNTESVRDGQEALVIPARSARHLAEAMTRLIEDRTLARRLSDAARRRVASRFTIDHMLDGTEAWLRQCVRMTRPRSV
jgi:glycosyltransferase involved in cell wall biosynthesis